MDWPDIKAIREEIGLSQLELASYLGVSSRTVQSCEHGWRTPGAAVEKSLLLLWIIHRRGAAMQQFNCWEQKNCPPAVREKCMSYISRQGHLCWFITGNQCQCRSLHAWSQKKAVCRSCAFFQQLIEETSALELPAETSQAGCRC